MTDQGLAAFRLTLTPGEPERRITICGEEGTLILSSDWVTLRQGEDDDRTMTLSNEVNVFRQRADDADPVRLEIGASDRQPPALLSGQHTWTDQGLAAFRLTLTPGEPERRITICGEEGTLILSSDWVTLRQGEDDDRTMTLSNEVNVFRQRADDADPVRLEIGASDRQPPALLSGQHTWNRLIADFVTAVRRGDVRHESVPHLPHVSDGLAAQEVISACELSHAERRWVDLRQTSERGAVPDASGQL